MIRNCLYFCCPLGNAGESWRQNVRTLRRWGDQFDGKRSVCVACDDSTESVQAVLKEFGDWRIDSLLVVRNDPILRETAHWLRLLETVTTEPGMTWFGHTKGVAPFTGSPTAVWASACYETTLGFPALVDGIMDRAVVTGPFRMRGKFWPTVQTASTWLFAGTFFWMKNSVLFGRDWNRVENHRWGVEAYPSTLFGYEESETLFMDTPIDLYSAKNWRNHLTPELDKWRTKNG